MSDSVHRNNGGWLLYFRRVMYFVPFVIGTAGYLMSGAALTDAMYSAFGLYTVSAVLQEHNWLIELARWTAPLAAATAVIAEIGVLRVRTLCYLKSLSSNSVAVYSDTAVKVLNDGGRKVMIYSGMTPLSHAKRHIILFSSDERGLEFYENNRSRLRGGNVYIGLREIEPGLVSEDRRDNGCAYVKLVDLSGAIARRMWKCLRLWNIMCSSPETQVNIVICGDSMLAEDLLSYGLLLNLYSVKQRIVYHVVSSRADFKRKHPEFDTMNDDRIMFYGYEEESAWSAIRNADYVLVGDVMQLEDLQVMIANVDENKLYLYSPDENSMVTNIGLGLKENSAVHRFGRNSGLLTYQNICEDALVETAKRLNDEYAKNFAASSDTSWAWENLSRFFQNSNISSADYQEVMRDLVTCSHADTEQLARLEHIRWCRFYFLNYWKYGKTADGRKDCKNRIHPDLVAYDELDETERDKNVKPVAKLIELMNDGRNNDHEKDICNG